MLGTTLLVCCCGLLGAGLLEGLVCAFTCDFSLSALDFGGSGFTGSVEGLCCFGITCLCSPFSSFTLWSRR